MRKAAGLTLLIVGAVMCLTGVFTGIGLVGGILVIFAGALLFFWKGDKR